MGDGPVRLASHLRVGIWVKLALLVAMTIVFAVVTHADAASRLPDIDSSSKFLVYYGSDFSLSTLELMTTFDVVVLNPSDANSSGLTPAVVAFLQNNGVRYVLAYISIGEDDEEQPVIPGTGVGPVYHDGAAVIEQGQGVASFYVDQEWDAELNGYSTDGLPDVNVNFGSRFVIPNAEWRAVLLDQRLGGSPGLPNRSVPGLTQIAGAREGDLDSDPAHDFGFDGFFLDTLDTAGPFDQVWGYYPWAAKAMRDTVKFIHETFPDRTVLANRGIFFHHPGLVNSTFDIRPYDFAIRPYIHAALFESYSLDSNSSQRGLSPYAGDNKHNFAPKLMAEANRPDGFTVFSLDYEMGRGEDMYAMAVDEAVTANGWTEYLAPDGHLDTVGTYSLSEASVEDTTPPMWDSTGSPPYSPGDVPDRVGVQSAVAGLNPGEVIVHWDVARDQSLPIRYNIYQSSTSDFSTFEVYPSVPYEIGDGWDHDPTSAFANKYVISGLAPGTYYFRVRAQDSSPFSLEEQNTVTLSVTLAEHTIEPVSNPVTGMVVDGELSEWIGLTSFGADPDDIAGTTSVADWREAWMAHDESTIYLAYLNDSAMQLTAAFNVYVDADSNRNTGFRGSADDFSVGAEYLLQGIFVYQYTGNGTTWSWSYIGQAQANVNGDGAELAVSRDVFGNPHTITLFFHGDNWFISGEDTDVYPDRALDGAGGGTFQYHLDAIDGVSNDAVGLSLDGDLSDWAPRVSFGLDIDDIPGDELQVDWVTAWMANDDDAFYLAYRNDHAISIGWAFNIYMDADVDRGTGFRGGGNDFPLGAEFLIQGTAIYQYTGNGMSWGWEFLGSMDGLVQGTAAEFSFPRSIIGDPERIHLFFLGENAAFGGTTQDYFPNDAASPGGNGPFFTYRTF